MAVAAGGTPPLRLKDLLELDCDSCSAAGFRCYPRRLCEPSSSPVPWRHLLESPSLRSRPGGKLSHLSRSLSRRLGRGGFWRRRDEVEDDDAAAEATETAVSTAGFGSEELETSSSGRTSRRRSRSESDSVFSSSATSASDEGLHHPLRPAAADEHDEVVVMKRVSNSSSGSEADDKQQLSPVAVMDFPFDDDNDDEELLTAPSFTLARLQRRKTLAPLDLEARLATTSDEPDVPAAVVPIPTQAQQMIHRRTEGAATPTCTSSSAGGVHDVPADEDDLISLLMGTVSLGLDDVSERLLIDFFVEMKRRRSEARAEAEAELHLPGAAAAAGVLRRKAELVVDGDAVAAAARSWLDGTGTERWGLTDVLSGGAAIVAEMERGRRWMQVGEEQREVGALMAGMLVDQLVDEVLRCFFV